jgi:hypothetical protein
LHPLGAPMGGGVSTNSGMAADVESRQPCAET